ncbi:choice-of-anchor D domain-containing protein [Luteolibacter soli]|uniref:Choice-of-anchor D domain-containing protein n=1 Tax=Luteolibacter soli TaxID=3135280 RepID=A0ABU9B4X2_9BACT
MTPLSMPSLAPLLRLCRRRKRGLLALSLALAAGYPLAEGAAIPYSQARIFQSTSTARQVDTLAGRSVALGQTLAVIGSPYDNVGGEESGVVWVHDATSGALLQRFDNPSPFKQSHFGWSVAVSGSLVAVGVPDDNTNENDAGIVYVYNLASSTPSFPVFVLPDPSPAENDSFGSSVAMSGSRLVVGAPKAGANAGRVYAYNLSSGSPTTPVVQINNPAATVNFGHAVAIDGTRIVASALQETGTGDTCRVHVFDLNSPTPNQPLLSLADPTPASNDQFGFSVAILGNRVAATAPLHDNGFNNSGIAYIYDTGSGTPAVPQYTLLNPAPALDDNFGTSITLAGSRAVVGVALDDQGGTDSGVACVYDFNSGSPTVPVLTIQNPGAPGGDEFGRAVSLFGNRLLVSAPDDDVGISLDVGSAYLFDLSTGTPATALFMFNDASPSSHEEFGFSVAISGNLAVVGSQKDDKIASNAGTVSVYNLAAAFPEQPILVIDNPSPTTNDYFGTAVGVSGTKVVVSAYQEDTSGNNNAGAVYIYDTTSPTPGTPVRTLINPTPQSQDQFGNSVAISGNYVVVGCAKNDVAPGVDAGSAYVYDLTSATPTVPILTLDNPAPANDDWFGHAVSISGTKLVVGAHQNDTGAVDAGSVYVYDIASGTPTVPIRVIDNPAPATDDEFGYSVGISGNRIVIGCRQDDAGATDAGSAYLYDLSSPNPGTPVATLVHPDPENEEYFGTAVAISGTRIIVSAPEDDLAATDGGCGYVYEVTSATFPQPADRVVSEDQPDNEQLGFSVAIDGVHVLMGAPQHDGNTVGRGAAYIFDPQPPTPQMQVEQPPGTGLIAGQASIQFGNVAIGSPAVTQTVTIRNVGTSDLQVTGISLMGGNSENFAAQPVSLPATLPVDQILQFNVSFTSTTTGTRITTLKIDSNASIHTFEVTLTGQALSSADDTDGDGINDVAELSMQALGFDWQVNDEELVAILQAGANSLGLYGQSQMEAIHGTQVITVDGGTGRYTLKLPVEKSVDLMNFSLYPIQTPAVSIGGQGSLDLQITPAGSRGFFRFDPH